MVKNSMSSIVAPLKKDFVAVQRGRHAVEQIFDTLVWEVNALQVSNQSEGDDARDLAEAVGRLTGAFEKLQGGAASSRSRILPRFVHDCTANTSAYAADYRGT